MRRLILLFMFSVIFNSFLCANYSPIVIQNGGSANDHFEHYSIADMPDAVYYDSDEGEIIIEADGTSSYYNVQIVSNYLNQTVISTQINGYGDTIDISSLPDGNYTIVITSEFLNEYVGQFSI